MKKLYFIISIFMLPLCVSFAQEEANDSLERAKNEKSVEKVVHDLKKEEVKKEVEKKTSEAKKEAKNKKSKQEGNEKGKNIAGRNEQQMEKLQNRVRLQSDSIAAMQSEIDCLMDKVDSLKNRVEVLDKSSQEKEIERLKSRLVFADLIIARLSNDCLRKKYSKEHVDEAIENFEHMYSPQLKKHFIRLKELLVGYGEYSAEIENILAEAQNDKDLRNLFIYEKIVAKYVNRIKQTRYYKECYNSNWTIMYLDEVIKEFFAKMKGLNGRNCRNLDLSGIMK